MVTSAGRDKTSSSLTEKAAQSGGNVAYRSDSSKLRGLVSPLPEIREISSFPETTEKFPTTNKLLNFVRSGAPTDDASGQVWPNLGRRLGQV